jgi:hypothetical protein
MSNQNFATLALESGGSIVNLSMPSQKCEGFALTNPSIFNDNGKIICNIRNVQYALYHSENKQQFQSYWGVLSYLHPEDDMHLRTQNALCYDLLEKTSEFNYVDTTELDKTPLWEFIGLEDARIVRWDGKLYLCGVRRDTTTNGEGRMELSEIVDGKEVNRYRIEPPNGHTYCEKNWMPVVDLPYHFVKWTNPTEVVKVNIETLQSEVVYMNSNYTGKLERDLRGGSQVLSYKDHYIALTHEVNLFNNVKGNKDGQYYHRFVVWDKDWNIVKTSSAFKFLDAHIEFCCGMAQVTNNCNEEEFWITFGYQDASAFLLKMSCEKVWDYIFKGYVGVMPFKNFTETFDKFAINPSDADLNFDLGKKFYTDGYYSSSLSFFLRCAERSDDENQTYESLLLVALSIAKLGRRRTSEKTAYLNAIAFEPKRFEAYYFLSHFYEAEKDYHNCYAMAKIALSNYFNFYSKDNLSYLDNVPLYKIEYQIAFSSWWVGKFEHSLRLMHDLTKNIGFQNFEPQYKQMIQNNMQMLGSMENAVYYDESKLYNFIHPFEGIDLVERNYSQSYQDMFVLTMLNGKRNGVYLEIGSADPFKNNNTYLLESKFSWEGKGIEIEAFEVAKYNVQRKNNCIHKDATQVDYEELLSEMSNYYQNDGCFDYLQVDCEPSTTSLQILKMIPFDSYKFAVITFEHDDYSDVNNYVKFESRTFLESKGYVLVVPNVGNNDYCPYEDWWVHPDLVDNEIIAKIKTSRLSVTNIEKFMLGYK